MATLTAPPAAGDGQHELARDREPGPEQSLEAGIDFERANPARIYDFFLGGASNFAVDRDQAATILEHNPDMARVCRVNRTYLRRAVDWCLDQGITQFLDLGSGVPTVGNVHEVAHLRRPEARVAYVDFEPVAVAHATELVADLDTVTVTRADLRDPERVLDAPGVRDLLDLTRPVALLSIAVLHFVADPRLPDIMSRYRAALAPGSVQAISHGSTDHDDPELAASMRATQDGYRGSAAEVVLRDRDQIHELLGRHDLVDPGLVDIAHWPALDPDVLPTGAYAAVARLP